MEVGKLLIQAKDALEHGEFLEMVETQLPFHATTAGRLMLIARHGVISNYAHVHNLPSSWGTLAVLAQLSQGQFLKHLRAGAIHPEMERNEAQTLIRGFVGLA